METKKVVPQITLGKGTVSIGCAFCKKKGIGYITFNRIDKQNIGDKAIKQNDAPDFMISSSSIESLNVLIDQIKAIQNHLIFEK